MNHYYVMVDAIQQAVVLSVAAFPILYDWLAEKFV